MSAVLVNPIENFYYQDNAVPEILKGLENVFRKENNLNAGSGYQNYHVADTSGGIVKSHTISYKDAFALRRIYSGIPPFAAFDDDRYKIEEFRKYTAALNEDVVNFLSGMVTILKDRDNPLASYIIPEMISNAVKSNYVIEKKVKTSVPGEEKTPDCILDVACIADREYPEHVDLVMRNYARFHQSVEKSIEKALNCNWTKNIKLIKEKNHRENSESSEYGLPSINNAVRKFYNGELFYDGYDDSYTGFGAYQFTIRLPKEKAGVR